MPHPDAQLWNARYLAGRRHFLRRRPHPLLCAYADQLPPGGLALDMAAGAVANGVFLAGRGLRVIAMDIAEAGLRLGQKRARELSLPLALVVMDLGDPWLPASGFDVILNFYYLSRPLFESYRQALKPGGWLFFETYVQDTRRRLNSSHYLEPAELHSAFQDWEILHWAEIHKARRGAVLDSDRIAQLVARKPCLEERIAK
jgi:tellurite methyltransferase